MTNEDKLRILNEIEKVVPVFKKISDIQYAIRCPICGDSQKELKTTHCYIKCGYDPNEPLLYKCFKCNSSGKITPWFLRRINASQIAISLLMTGRYNKIRSTKNTSVDIITGKPIMDSPQTKYIDSRLGHGFTYDDYDKFKIIWDIDEIRKYVTSARVRNTLPNNHSSISFLSDDRRMMITRTFLDGDNQWRKITINPSDDKSFYTIKTTINLFTTEPIVVNIAEGVMDVISIYKNFNQPNSVYIATLGSDYSSAVDYAFDKGFIGSNIILNIYVDDDINEDELFHFLKKHKWLCGSIHVYKNILSKDVGTRIEKIKLEEKII